MTWSGETHHRRFVLLVVAFLSLPPGVSAAAPSRVLITSAYPEASTGKLYVYGDGFGTTAPSATFAGMSVTVLSSSNTTLALSVPYGLLNNPGTYLVTVSRGTAAEDNSTLGVTVSPPGGKGDKGDTGAAGPAGVAGSKGDKGEPGLPGAAGATGATGPAGATGAKGDTGLPGAKGDIGPKGDTGLPGSKGDKGDTGPEGPAGSGVACAVQSVTGYNVVDGPVLGPSGTNSNSIGGTITVQSLASYQVVVQWGSLSLGGPGRAKFLVQCRNGRSYILDIYDRK